MFDTAAVHQTRERFGYDARGQLDWRWGPYDAADTDTVPVAGLDTAWFYGFDDAGRVTEILGPKDKTEFEYDGDGIIAAEIVHGVTRHDYYFDNTGTQLQLETTGDSATPDFRLHSLYYDARNQHVEFDEWAHGPDHQISTHTDWDASGTPRYSSSELNGVLEWQQSIITDTRGRVRSSATDSGMGVIPVTYDYTPGGRISHVSVPGAGWSYTYTAGMLQQMQIDAGPVVAQINNRDGMGRAIDLSLAYGGHIQRAYGYSGAMESETVLASSGATTTLAYEYDTLGQMSATIQSGTLGARRDEYEYSFEGWLLHEDRDVDVEVDRESTLFSYDPAGNRITRTRTTATTVDLTTYTYAGGNRLVSVKRDADLEAWLGWNGLGEVVEMADGTAIDRYPDGSERAVVGATATADIVRDAFGRPAVIDDGGTTPTMQVWGNPGANLPLAGVDADGLPFANLAVEGILVGELHGATLTVAATDGHGDLVLTGNTELMARPGAFGDAADLPTTSANRYRWGGQAQLAGTQLSLAQHRLYDADAGVWLSADPIGLAGGDHRFGFVGNSPLMGVDPSGLYATDPVTSYGAGSPEHSVQYSLASLAGMNNSTSEAVSNAAADPAIAVGLAALEAKAAAEAAAAAAEVDAGTASILESESEWGDYATATGVGDAIAGGSGADASDTYTPASRPRYPEPDGFGEGGTTTAAGEPADPAGTTTAAGDPATFEGDDPAGPDRGAPSDTGEAEPYLTPSILNGDEPMPLRWRFRQDIVKAITDSNRMPRPDDAESGFPIFANVALNVLFAGRARVATPAEHYLVDIGPAVRKAEAEDLSEEMGTPIEDAGAHHEQPEDATGLSSPDLSNMSETRKGRIMVLSVRDSGSELVAILTQTDGHRNASVRFTPGGLSNMTPSQLAFFAEQVYGSKGAVFTAPNEGGVFTRVPADSAKLFPAQIASIHRFAALMNAAR